MNTAVEIIAWCKEHKATLYEAAIYYEAELNDYEPEALREQMGHYLSVMMKSIEDGFEQHNGRKAKIIERKANDVYEFSQKETCASGDTLLKAVSYGLSVMEVNTTMGHIVAAPTAGASGVLPGVFRSLKESFHLSDETLIDGLFVAGLIGTIIATHASISGAKGGCQAEVGSGSAMACGAGLYMLGASLEEVFDGAAIAIKNLMGLVCDPVAGLVEVPCQKRNGIGIANALMSIDMVRASMVSYIPFDEVVAAMKNVGDLMPTCHRETGKGGIADTPTGKAYKEQIFG